ncbi:hypothetical protein DFS33DRAFT_1380604 [Desarmillaria ectypa]|nr:hypothetical protein DFS33DRAFT_1380604 [Desarmillaria ectypa]
MVCTSNDLGQSTVPANLCIYPYTLSTTDPRELPSEVLQYVSRFILSTKTGCGKCCETFNHTPPINELEECLCHSRGWWLDPKETSYRRLAEHSDACEKWAPDRAAENAGKLQSLRVTRANSPPFSGLIFDKPEDEEVSEEDFTDALTHIEEIAADWQKAKVSELQTLFANSNVSSNLDVTALVFDCSACGCGSQLRYLRVLMHSCFSKEWQLPASKTTDHETAHVENARAVVTACGLDPDTGTSTDIYKLDPRLIRMNRIAGTLTKLRTINFWRIGE